jgi:membrane-bound lytic murein transglycosylase A
VSSRFRVVVSALAALLLAACANVAPPPPAPTRPVPAPPPSSVVPPHAGALLPLTSLPGWETEDHAAAFEVVRRACGASPHYDQLQACAEAEAWGSLGEHEARAFLERRFRAEPIGGEGLLTGYFAPAYEARRRADAEFSAPVRPPPANAAAAPDRAAIARWPARDALAWMRPEDLFFLQVQGSGTLTFADGSRSRAVYAGANGQPFVAIARPLIAEHRLAPSEAGMVHAWLAEHRGPEAEAAMNQNPRYIFFRLIPDDGREPHGASGMELIAGRSLAVDPAAHPYGELLWIDGEDSTLSGARPAYRRLAAALDTGSAIRGEVRADLYVGRGEAAGQEAARVRHALRLYRIVPAEPTR